MEKETMVIVGTREELDVIHEVLTDLKEKMPEILKERKAKEERECVEKILEEFSIFLDEFADASCPVLSVVESEESCDCDCCECCEDSLDEENLRAIVTDIDARLTHLIAELKINGYIKR